MNTLLKTAALTISIAILMTVPANNANAGTRRECDAAYRECILSGYPEVDCENGYWICRYGYIPAKGGRIAMMNNIRD